MEIRKYLFSYIFVSILMNYKIKNRKLISSHKIKIAFIKYLNYARKFH
jgi:hypothetical protein